MRLEILVDSEEPIIYPLNKPEIIIGAGDACDIILGSAGISRKHVKVVVEKDSYFVIDQGSTNGTFINEERLVPGRRTEFTSFFPVRLGARVLLTLLSDEEAHDSILKEFSVQSSKEDVGNESTRVLSLKDIQATSTKKLVSNRQAIIAKKKVTAKAPAAKRKEIKDSSRMRTTLFVTALILGAAYYFNFHFNQEAPVVKTTAEPVVTPPPVPVNPVVEAAPAATNYSILSDELVPIEKLTNLFGDLKCLIPEEIYFCDKIPSLKKGNGGVAAVGTALIFLIEQTEWFNVANSAREEFIKQNLHIKTTVTDEEMAQAMQKLAFLNFVKTEILKADLAEYQEKILYFVFYREAETGPIITKVFAIKSRAIPELIKQFDINRLQNFYRYGPSALKELDQFYSSY